MFRNKPSEIAACPNCQPQLYPGSEPTKGLWIELIDAAIQHVCVNHGRTHSVTQFSRSEVEATVHQSINASKPSVQTQHFHGGGLRVAVEDGINMLDHISRYFEKASLVLDRNEGALGAIVLGDLERFSE